jgi:Recombination endonuclease VII
MSKRLQRKYGLTPEALTAMRDAQGNRCAVCGDPLLPGVGTHIDHDHATGQIRGLLCQACNLCEGYARGSALRLRKLAAYIEHHAPKLFPKLNVPEVQKVPLIAGIDVLELLPLTDDPKLRNGR